MLVRSAQYYLIWTLQNIHVVRIQQKALLHVNWKVPVRYTCISRILDHLHSCNHCREVLPKLNYQQLMSCPAFPAFIVLCIATLCGCVLPYCCGVITVNVLYLQDGATPLYIASQNGHLPVVEHLIGAKADVNHQRDVSYYYIST